VRKYRTLIKIKIEHRTFAFFSSFPRLEKKVEGLFMVLYVVVIQPFDRAAREILTSSIAPLYTVPIPPFVESAVPIP